MTRCCDWCHWAFEVEIYVASEKYCSEACQRRARQWKDSGIDRLKGQYLVVEITDAEQSAHSWSSHTGPRERDRTDRFPR